MFANFCSNLADNETVSDSSVLFLKPSDNTSFFKPCKLESSSSRYRNLPTIDNTESDNSLKLLSNSPRAL
jgi:hypothetical protein